MSEDWRAPRGLAAEAGRALGLRALLLIAVCLSACEDASSGAGDTRPRSAARDAAQIRDALQILDAEAPEASLVQDAAPDRLRPPKDDGLRPDRLQVLDGAPDKPVDAEPDLADAPDATLDAAPDAEPDAALDAEPDAAPDAEPDAALDAAPALPDAARDAAPDVPAPPAGCVLDGLDRSYPTGALVPTDLRVLDDGYLLAGWGTPNVMGSARAWIARVDEVGEPRYEHWIGDGDALRTAEAAWLDGETVLMVGRTRGAQGSSVGWLGAISPEGALLADQPVAGPGQDTLHHAVPLADGAFVTGYKGTGAEAFWVLRFDAARAIRWQRRVAGGGWDQAYAGLALPDGGFAAAGTWRHGGAMVDARVIRFDAQGEVLLDETYGGAGWDEARAIALFPGGDLAVSGYHGANGWVARVDAQGAVVWAHELAPLGQNLQLTALDVDAAGRVLVAGHPWWDGNARSRFYLFSAEGEPLDAWDHGDHHVVSDLRWLEDGRFVAFGGFAGMNGYRGGGWLVGGRCP